jgi:hypothetical protein
LVLYFHLGRLQNLTKLFKDSPMNNLEILELKTMKDCFKLVKYFCLRFSWRFQDIPFFYLSFTLVIIYEQNILM